MNMASTHMLGCETENKAISLCGRILHGCEHA